MEKILVNEKESLGNETNFYFVECHKVFALMVRSNQELKEKLFSFTITDEEVNKTNYLRTLCRQMANTVCKPDAVCLKIIWKC